MNSFVSTINTNMNGSYYNPDENVFKSIWNEYESVILQSLVTSFGLDFFINDRYGGDVDTVHNVRQIGTDSKIEYKNIRNEKAYQNRGDYDSYAYHSDWRYRSINRNVSKEKKAGTLIDSYTGKVLSPNSDVDLDHAISSKEIHEDRGRILAGLSGLELANNENNLKPTDRTINRSMQAKDMEDFLAKWEAEKDQRKAKISYLKSKESLTDQERANLKKLEQLDQIDPQKMRNENRKARKSYEAQIQKAYYTSPNFYKDMVTSAGSLGVRMGIRQAIGFVFVEIYMGAKKELTDIPAGSSLSIMLKAVATGAKKGADNARENYKDIFSKFGEGFISGTLASITTTICNIFITTAKNIVKSIRQIYASVVQAGKILLFNPDNLMLGERIKTSTIILATGASVLVGTSVSDLIGKSPIGAIPGVGPFVQTFSGTLVSGLLSCTLLIFLDRSKFMNNLIDKLDSIPSEVNNYKEVADAFELLAAKLENLDISKFKEDTEKYQNIAVMISNSDSIEQTNNVLLEAYKDFNIKIPWEGDFDSFMGNKDNKLVFE